MAKYHINKNGKPAICRAKEGNCPLGNSDSHFASKEDAQAFVDKQEKQKHGLLPGVDKKKESDKPSREDKVQECFDRIEQGVQDVFTSDNFKNYLSFASKFHRYSYNNILLILSQRPNATQVAGFKKWTNDFKRTVKKGEKGIMILAPSTYDRKEYVNKLDSKGSPIINKSTGKPEKEVITVQGMYFRPAYVFDVSQTEGEPLPTLTKELEGTSEEAKSIIASVQQVSSYEVKFVSGEEDRILRDGAKGYCSFAEKIIVVNKDLSDTQQAKTLIHELAHAELHENSKAPKEQKEVEAESVAYTLSNYFGLDTSEYSFPYIAAWGGKDSAVLKDALKNIQTKTAGLIDKLEPLVFKKK
jgi:hypothetical protein